MQENTNIVFNGGDPLQGCPISWEEAEKWENEANSECKYDWERPKWSFDCGFKLDYDGPVLRVSSRFYPPKQHYGKTWDGTLTLYVFDKKVNEVKFDCQTLEQLKNKVESYIYDLRIKIESIFQ